MYVGFTNLVIIIPVWSSQLNLSSCKQYWKVIVFDIASCYLNDNGVKQQTHAQNFRKIWKMMASSKGNIFCVIGPAKSTGHRWIPLTKASDAEFWRFLWSASEQRLRKQPKHRRSLWRHRNEIYTINKLRSVSNTRTCYQCVAWFGRYTCPTPPSRFSTNPLSHYSDVIMSPMASQIASLTIVYSTVFSGAIKENIKALRHWLRAGNSPMTAEFPHKQPATRKMFPFDDVIMSIVVYAGIMHRSSFV